MLNVGSRAVACRCVFFVRPVGGNGRTCGAERSDGQREEGLQRLGVVQAHEHVHEACTHEWGARSLATAVAPLAAAHARVMRCRGGGGPGRANKAGPRGNMKQPYCT